MGDTVQAWSESVLIPTYPVGPPQKNPLFIEKRVYQGSSGAVYPYPVIESIGNQPEEQPWQALYLENAYLKIMVLPELGGRLQMALDKTNGYHFIYYNQVIKPALVGLTGPWISGGIEFNWPQHHRPTTYSPLDWRIDENPDGSKTIWCAEFEPMFNTKGMHGFTLYPDRAILELNVQLSNRTSLPQTFLWWANPAVHVNDDYQSIFPPDVHAVMDHGKRDVSDFPIATGTYYKQDYAPGTDISRYKNIPVPTSYMAYHSDFNFIGCYDHGQQAGMMHVANHHVVPGKKQWTWGNGDFGQAWDRQLTDEDGPYIELMCGAFTDNQPDFSWIMPGEEKSFRQVFMPFKQIGGAKNASEEAVLNLEIEGQQARIGVYLTQPGRVQVELRHADQLLMSEALDLDPQTVLDHWIELPAKFDAQELTLRVSKGERLLLACSPPPAATRDIPEPAKVALPPEAIDSNEALFLNGLHLEQYRHATYDPEPYYREALRRDPLDSRCNNALGLRELRRGRFAAAEPYFRTAIQSLTRRNPNPYDGEPYYNLGLCLKYQDELGPAFDAFYKAVWNRAWQDPAYFELARIACRQEDLEQALELITRSLQRNWTHHKARHLKVALLRRLGRDELARAEVQLALELDRFEYGALAEQDLLTGKTDFNSLADRSTHTATEIGLDYAHAGLFDEALHFLTPIADPLSRYYAGWVHLQAGRAVEARDSFQQAAQMPVDFCFPNRPEAVLALQAAAAHTPKDAKSRYLLGNYFYAHQAYDEAQQAWETSRELDPHFSTVHRNLGLAYYNRQGNPDAAQDAYEQALICAPQDARILYELDQLYKVRNRPPAERLAFLEARLAQVLSRDDLTVEYVALLNVLGRHQQALDLLNQRRFNPWEGGEGKTVGQYVYANVQLAQAALRREDWYRAIDFLNAAQTYPDNLGEGKLSGAQENNVFYWLGVAHEGAGRLDRAQDAWQQASIGLSEPTSALYYNDQPPEMIFYQGLAYGRLKQATAAREIFERLLQYGQQHLDDTITMDYFAVSLPDFLVFDSDLSLKNQVHCRYMMALGYLGLEQREAAEQEFTAVLELDSSHSGALSHESN
jgi:tetratricopeptide (TPR) repeat protein